MDRMSRILSIGILLTMLLGSVTIASPLESNTIEGAQEFSSLTAARAADGSLWAAWVADFGTDREIVASRWQSGQWDPAAVVYDNPDRWDAAPSLAIDASGVPWLAWASSAGEDGAIYLSHWAGRGWSEPIQVSAETTMPNRQPTLAAGPNGGLWLAWVGFDGNDDEVYASHYDGLAWSEPQRVNEDDSEPAAYDVQPAITVGPDRSVWIAWTGYEKFMDDEIFASRWDGARWLAEEQVSEDDDSANSDPSLAIGEDGTVWLAWQGRLSDSEKAGRRIHARQWIEGAGWSTEAAISSPQESVVTEHDPCLALDAGGQPHVTWLVNDGLQGMGYASYDGSDWSVPQWAVEESVAESVCLVEGDLPQLTWWPAGTVPSLPTHSIGIGDSPATLPVFEAPGQQIQSVQWITNRHLAFGDSITWGKYPDPANGEMVGDYPGRLQVLLNTRVTPSEVINDGVPSEKTGVGRDRLLGTSWPTYEPEFLELMEGTNDVTSGRSANSIIDQLDEMVYWPKKGGVVVLLATLIPRLDEYNKPTKTVNEMIRELAAKRKVHLVDTWDEFYAYGDWGTLFADVKHPNAPGMAYLAEIFYAVILEAAPWLDEDKIPPTTWIDSLPPESECGQVLVKWAGSDNMGSVVDYDVQANVNNGGWSDWLLKTAATSKTYPGGSYNDTMSFRVRGRDEKGNQNDYSAPATTKVVDKAPPYDLMLGALPAVQTMPFDVYWSAKDACAQVAAYEVEYCPGSLNNCQPWVATSDTSATFDIGSPQYGGTYLFRMRAQDAAGNKNQDWSSAVSTTLARFSLAGQTLNVRRGPMVSADVVATGSLAVERTPGGWFEAYMPDVGNYALSASRDGFGSLPAMHFVNLSDDATGLELVLPPADDVVKDGDFEAGDWAEWHPSGTLTPTLAGQAHTGYGAVLMGSAGESSALSQTISIPISLTDATLSFMVRLDDETDGSSTLQAELAGTAISQTVVVPEADWAHVWFPVDAATGQVATLTFTLSDTAAIHLDEVRLGSALSGGSVVYLPIALRDHGQ